VHSKTVWIGGEAAKGYLLQDFGEAFKRYIPRSEWEAMKAEWRAEDEGRKSQVSDQSPEEGGPKVKERERKPQPSGQKPGVQDQTFEIDGQKPDETGETPGSGAGAA
jgi:hypothetical protein